MKFTYYVLRLCSMNDLYLSLLMCNVLLLFMLNNRTLQVYSCGNKKIYIPSQKNGGIKKAETKQLKLFSNVLLTLK